MAASVTRWGGFALGVVAFAILLDCLSAPSPSVTSTPAAASAPPSLAAPVRPGEALSSDGDGGSDATAAAERGTSSVAVARSWLGGPCLRDADCAVKGGRCQRGPEYPGGHCTVPCEETCPDRPGEPITYCVGEPGAAGRCVSRCDYALFPGAAAGCREGYECVLASSTDDAIRESVCAPASSGPPPRSAPLPWQRRRGGRQALVRLHTAPFPHKARAGGYTVDGVHYPRAGHYDDSAAYLIVPHDFVDVGRVDLIVHFHGFNGDIHRLVETKKLREQFFEARRNAVLVLVQGPKNVPDAHPGNMGEIGGFLNLVTEVLGLLHADGLIAFRRLGNVVLTSHSGGYRSVASALDLGLLDGRISEVYLFDSFYGEHGRFFDYVTKTSGRFISIVTSELAGANANFKWRLDAANVGYATRLEAKERITLLRTNVSHAHAPLGNYRRFLAGGNLPALPRTRGRGDEEVGRSR
jgi:hypothetical protein